MSRAAKRGDRVPPVEDGWTTLDAVLDGVWSALARAAGRSRDGWHTPTLCTVTPAGEPAARTVVLRDADRAARRLVCHTDRRSPKVAEIERAPAVVWMFYDAARKTQLRVRAEARVRTTGEAADARWSASRLSSRRCYLAPYAPGEPVPPAHEGPHPNLPDHLTARDPTEAETAPGRDRFAVIDTTVRSMDWLYLKHDGHRRARFAWDDAGALDAAWVMP